MKAKVSKEIFREAVSRINKIMKKNDLIYTKMILLEAKNESIYLTGIQNSISMRTLINEVALDEPFSCLFEGNMILALLSKMASAEVVLEYNQKKAELHLTDEKSKARVKIRCEDPKKFAGWKELIDPDFEKETDVLFPNISSCKHALPTKDSSAIMSSFCIQYGADDWKITAIDGMRVSSRGVVDKVENTILVPGDTMTLLESIYLDKKVIIATKGEDMWLRDEQTEVYLRTVSGSYYNIDKIVNADHKYKIMMNRDELLNVLILANVSLLNESVKRGVFVFDGKGKSLEIQAKDSIGNEMNSLIPFESNDFDKTIKLGMNMKFILEAVKSVPDEVVVMELSSEISPIKISGNGYTEIVLPVKLHA